MGALAHPSRSPHGARWHCVGRAAASPRCAGAAAGARMNDFLRLLTYARRYWFFLTPLRLLMALVGPADTSMAPLIGPLFDPVLKQASPDTPVGRLTLPE